MSSFFPFPATSRSSGHYAGNPIWDSDRLIPMAGKIFGIRRIVSAKGKLAIRKIIFHVAKELNISEERFYRIQL